MVIRPIRVEDAEGLLDQMAQPLVVAFTGQLPSTRLEGRRQWVEHLGPADHVFVAEVDGRVVASAGLHVQRGKRRHVASLGISVHDAFQGRGIGRALMATLLDLADNFLALRRVELEVMADNPGAIHLYESLGFQVEGRKREDIVLQGRYVDVLFMGRLRQP
ncbi:MAG TPA: GNAT family N-acetyltransferase [Bacillota bacterium]|nr:GNAT family N-acetyltransferase [Bacillota bacterium]